MDTPPAPSFSPALTVSALAIRNLDSLSYTRYIPALSPNASPSVFPRARWLEHGIGRSNALPIAAAALLADLLPAALPALVPTTLPAKSTSKASSRPPTLWVFAPPPALARATVLLADAFAPAETAQWTAHAPSQVTQALLDALRRAIVSSLHAVGALSFHDQIVHPATNLAYVISLSHNPPATHVLLRLRVRRSTFRHLTDLDQPTPNSPPLHVIASPLAVKATLAPRPPAGDALTESVLCRWRESGLLPSNELVDPVVVFLRLPGGVDVPFPRAVVLTTAPQVEEKKNERKIRIPKASTEPAKKEKPKNAVTVKSKKRPRSPAMVEKEVKKEAFIPQAQDTPQDATDRFAADIPTAESINEAFELAKKAGDSDPVPVLLHPVAEEIVPPSFVHEAEYQEGNKVSGGPVEEIQSSQLVEEKQNDGGDILEKRRIDEVSLLSVEEKPPPVSVVKQESKENENIDDDIDGFLQVGDSTAEQAGFDTGPTMDITDFTAFDDEVADFFRDNIDDRLPVADNAMPSSDEVGRSAQQGQITDGYRLSEQESGLLQSTRGGAKQYRVSKMDVDTELQKSSEEIAEGSVQEGGNILKAQNVLSMALSSLRVPAVIPRPDDRSLHSRLSTFYEDDLIDRRLVRLNASGSIGKRSSRSERKARRALVRIKEEFNTRRNGKARRTPSVNQQYDLVSPVTYKVSFDRAKEKAMDIYVPRRKMKVFTKLRQNGYAVTPTSVLSRTESESDSDIGEGDEDEVHSLPVTRDPINGEIVLPSEVESNDREGPNLSKSDEVTELEPLKIVDSVAVDCASACMVLAATCLTQNSHSEALSGSFFSSGDANGSLSKGEEEVSKGPVSLQADLKPISTLGNGRPQAPAQAGSPICRTVATKREREMLCMLSLLEMQAFSVKELNFFCEENIPCENSKFALNAQNGKALDYDAVERVSSASVRRVLLGLPRLLETSRIFGSCSASLREHDAKSSPLTVQGPLPVEDVLGEGSTVLPLDIPRVCVGFKNEWIETPGGVLPLWEKAGLEPYSERKNVEYVAVGPKEMETDVKLFLRDLSAAYEECSFGKHAAMPFDEVMLISNSTSKADRNRTKNPDLLSEYDKAMADQYHIAVTGLCTKLAAITRDHRKNTNGLPMNIVVYVISPFENGETAANVALLRAVSPLMSAVPGVVPSLMSVLGPSSAGMGLPSAPWRCASSSKGVVSITVRIIPREVVDRQLSGHAEIEYLLARPLRPQLVKAVSFAVFSSIRSKRVRSSKIDGEVAGMLARTPLMPDDLMSPMTPEIITESPSGNIGTPVSPKGNNLDDTGGSALIAAHGASLVDQCSALSPSFLYEPAITLSGVGSHIGQTNAKANIVLHLAYAYCESSSRYVFVWTDQRGEMMDIATVPVLRVALAASRRKAFWCMWTRGQRWKISYVGDVHATITKLGELQPDEVCDWDWVIAKVTQADSASNDKRYDDVPTFNIVRRFPPMEQSRGDEFQELYTDHPTPATPSTVQPSTQISIAKATISMDIKLPSISSVTILNVSETDEHLLMEIAERTGDESQRDFAVVSKTSLSERSGFQACAVLAYFGKSGIEAIELNVHRHYGKERHAEAMGDDRSPWDAPSAQAIASSIARNFHELRYIGTPPSWPHGRWLSKYPVHLDIVRRLQSQIGSVQKFAFSSSSFLSK